jgi:hypothetical protein
VLLAFELHDATSYILVLYYYKRREDSRGERQERCPLIEVAQEEYKILRDLNKEEGDRLFNLIYE